MVEMSPKCKMIWFVHILFATRTLVYEPCKDFCFIYFCMLTPSLQDLYSVEDSTSYVSLPPVETVGVPVQETSAASSVNSGN